MRVPTTVSVVFVREHQHRGVRYLPGDTRKVSLAERDRLALFGAVAPAPGGA